MAMSTCEGPTAPEEQAAPVEQAMPCRSSAITSASPPAAGNATFEVLETRCARLPFTRASLHDARSASSRRLRSDSNARAIRGQILARQFRSLAQANDARNIFSAGAAIAFVMAAVELRFERRAGANVERANSLGTVNFVRGNGEQIHAEAIYVERQLSRGLHRVTMKANIGFGGDAADFLDGLDGAEFVVGVHHADENGFRPERAAKCSGSTIPSRPTGM